MDFRKFLIPALLFFYSSVSSAQQNDSLPSYKLSEIVVSATKTETSTLLVASSVSVIDSQEIALREKATLLDILKSQYGLSYENQGNPGSNSFVTIRGAGNGHTLVLVDGMEMNRATDPGGTFDFSTITPDNIERIEILRGPQSTLYGSDALAGVINIFTVKGSPGLRLKLSSEGGSYNTYKGNASVSGGKGILNFNLNFGRTVSDGFSSAAEKYGNSEKDGWRNSTINGRIGLTISPDIHLDFRYDFVKAFAALDWAGGYGGDQDSYVSNTEESGFGAAALINALESWNQKISFSLRRNLRKYSYDYAVNSGGPSDSRYDGNRISASWQNDIKLPSNIITAGLAFEESEMNSEYHDYTPVFGFSSSFPNTSNNIWGVYLQDQLNLKNTFFAAAGIRYDRNKTFGSEVTYRIAPAYLISKTGTKLKATFGTGFKSPSLFYLFDPMYGNANLKPEKSKGWDAGLEQYFTNVSLTAGITYFNIDFNEMFGYDPVTYKTININKASSSGVEIYTMAEPFTGLRINANYTFTEPKEKTGVERFNYTRKPKHKAAVNADYIFPNTAYLGIEVIYNGKRTDKYFSTVDFTEKDVTLADYILLNLSASYNLLSNLKIYTRLENILNKKYEEVYGFGVPAFSIYAGIKVDTGDIFKW